MDTPNQTSSKQQNTAMAALAYIGPLVIVSYLTAKDDAFVKFHIKQGLVLFVTEIALWFVGGMFWPLWMIISLVNFGILVLAIVGIVNAVQGKETKLPIVGDFAKHFTF